VISGSTGPICTKFSPYVTVVGI